METECKDDSQGVCREGLSKEVTLLCWAYKMLNMLNILD